MGHWVVFWEKTIQGIPQKKNVGQINANEKNPLLLLQPVFVFD